MQNLLDSADYTIKSIRNLLDRSSFIEKQINELSKECNIQKNNLDQSVKAKEKYIKAVDILYEENIKDLKDTLNLALSYVIYDKKYTANMELEDKRGTKTLEITVYDNEEGFEVGLLDGVGNGVRTIISFVLKTYYLLNKDSKILFLDEKYSALSEHYIPRFFEFMKNLCETKGIAVIMITHDDRFRMFADKCYMINDGYVIEINNEEIQSGTDQ